VLSRCITDESYLSPEKANFMRKFFGLSGGGNLLRKFFSDIYVMRHQVFALCVIVVGKLCALIVSLCLCKNS